MNSCSEIRSRISFLSEEMRVSRRSISEWYSSSSWALSSAVSERESFRNLMTLSVCPPVSRWSWTLETRVCAYCESCATLLSLSYLSLYAGSPRRSLAAWVWDARSIPRMIAIRTILSGIVRL